jgi:SAM-dependent methyltransferase
MTEFDKYQTDGAYHWLQADPAWGNPRYNAPLAARYTALARFIPADAVHLLDLGCGDAYLMHLLGTPARYMVGVDNNATGIRLGAEQLRQHGHQGFQVMQGSSYQLPFKSGAFDAVTLADVIEHLDDPAQASAEMARVLRPGGTLALSTPNWNPDRPLSRFHVQEFKPEELRDLLAPHFSHINLYGCWHDRTFNLWQSGGWQRRAVDGLARLGLNTLAQTTPNITLQYQQLIAVAVR